MIADIPLSILALFALLPKASKGRLQSFLVLICGPSAIFSWFRGQPGEGAIVITFLASESNMKLLCCSQGILP